MTAGKTMLRLKGKHTSRISNRLAVFAALLLVVTSLAGIGKPNLLSNGAEPAMVSAERHESPPARLHSKGFKVSLFLFRTNR